MMFDHVYMNPPYDKNLHLKILEQSIPMLTDDGILVNLSPIRWLQDPLAKYKKSSDYCKFEESVAKHLERLEVVSKDDVFRLFSIVNSEDLGIYYITKNNSKWQGIGTKLLCEKCYDKIKDNLCTIDHNKKDGWRIRVCIISNSNHRKGGLNNLGKLIVFEDGLKDGKPWYEFYGKNKWSKTTPEITDSIRFDSKEEAENFIDSVENTKFGRWYEGHIITDIHISNRNILWLPTYKHKWTDEQLYKYFNLTPEEVKEIEANA